MTGQLVYVIGPSGAGKDSVLAALRARWPQDIPVHWARRTISRPSAAQGEQHEAVDAQAFRQLSATQAFALQWSANGLHYGVRHAELAPLRQGHWVFVNGSRKHLPTLLREWPAAQVVHIGASADILRRRLIARGRETAEAVEARLAREVQLQLPQGSIRIRNDGALEDAAAQLLAELRARSQAAAAPLERLDQ
ncbi:phosphonate metabolism protein/1,5-bisphosphokinase (PRPP-forming) PhnN [[Acidovorax] ebreus]|uniref:Ribose 1,5-bisphosphate phosphokinase PhnN n=1 Tax=Acidovorax ebreus (strain TPSY) TaxID=535289 RepID=A0A9J9UBR5_ACIET|nr:phosphonate metabolism protein/1,5-bisphosphokinase (PRPP-forming) PhnN [[Acidovorax] ebreus]ACM34361.1 phosphonate metabolism protein/1,5-bisphosphokinase (PRPP-forming) PhnN [[Acidovorax] ebreus TPSY]